MVVGAEAVATYVEVHQHRGLTTFVAGGDVLYTQTLRPRAVSYAASFH
jgi:hypothetical protein